MRVAPGLQHSGIQNTPSQLREKPTEQMNTVLHVSGSHFKFSLSRAGPVMSLTPAPSPSARGSAELRRPLHCPESAVRAESAAQGPPGQRGAAAPPGQPEALRDGAGIVVVRTTLS